MIKTLRITSIIAVVLAAGFFVFPAVVGFRSDERVEQFLNLPGVVEQFSKAAGVKAAGSEDQVSPLVQQAKAFALVINPPPPPKPVRPAQPRLTQIPTPAPRSPTPHHIKLIGTSVYASDPKQSLALIEEAGKGLHWVRQSSVVNYLTIEQVKDGVVVVSDGKKTYELVAERPPKHSLLKGSSGASTGAGVQIGVDSASIAASRDKADASVAKAAEIARASRDRIARASRDRGRMKTPTGGKPVPIPQRPDLQQRTEWMERVIGVMEEMRANRERSDKNGLGRSSKDDMVKFLEAMRVSTEEARKLDHLGQELKNGRRDPNRPKSQKIERPESSPEPNSAEQ